MATWVLAGVILTGAWTQLDEAGVAGWLALLAIVSLDRAATSRMPFGGPRVPAAAVPVMLGAAVCVLMASHVALTAGEEFGFGGDEGYHLSATRAFALYYMSAGPILVAALALFAFCRWRRWPYAASIAMAGLLVGSYVLARDPLFGRYPTGVYHLVTPLAVGFEIAGIPYPFTANHVINAMSVPAWLFVLRPLLLGRWPDWQVMPVALLVYFQGPALTYAGSALLEPWAFVFLLLSLEAVVALDRDRRWIAIPLAATATFFKETAILLLPAVWVACSVEWKGVRPSFRRGAIVLGAACAIPFLVYYSVRSGLQVQRTFDLASTADTWTRARLSEWVANVQAQVGVGGLLAIAIAVASTVVVRQWLWLLTAALIALFFFGDAASVPYTGYGRFVAYSLLALCGGVFAFTHAWSSRHTIVVAITLLIAVLQVVPFARVFALDFQPGYARNSLEWRHSLVRLPIRALANRMPEARNADQVRTVRVVAPGTDLTSLEVAYPDLADRIGLRRGDQDPGGEDCRCRDNAEAVLAAFEWPVHFGHTPADRARFEQVSASCVGQLNITCASIILEQHESGAVVGALGVGRVELIASPQHDQGSKR